MNRYLTAILGSTLLLIGLISIQANAQVLGSPEAHVAAAKAIAASVPAGAKNELDYAYIMQTLCTQPKPANPEQEARQLNNPPNTNARPHDEWSTDPLKV